MAGYKDVKVIINQNDEKDFRIQYTLFRLENNNRNQFNEIIKHWYILCYSRNFR